MALHQTKTLTQPAHTDELTGLLNRRGFLMEAQQVFDRSSASNLGLAAILLDLDHFKKVNAGFGREVGDEALRVMARIFREALRSQDVAGRYASGKFAAIVQCSALADACRMAQRMQARVQNRSLLVNDMSIPLTISVGVFFTRGTLPNVQELLKLATRSLHRAKRVGRDCWVCEEEP